MNTAQSLKAIHEGKAPKASTAKLSELWEHVKPFVVMAGTIFGRKIRPYIKAFVAALDAALANDESL